MIDKVKRLFGQGNGRHDKISQGQSLVQMGLSGFSLCIFLVVCNLLLGSLVSGGAEIRRSLAMVTGVRNISLSLLIAAAWFPDPLTDVAVLTFGLFTMVVPGFVAWIAGRNVSGTQSPRP